MASLYITRRIRTLLIFVVIMASLIIAFSRSKILKTFFKPEKTTIASTPEEATEQFESYMYYTKIDFKFVTEDIREKDNEVSRILKNTDFNEIYSKSTKNNNITKIIQLPIDSYRNVMNKLKQLPDLEFAELKKSEETASIEQLRKRLQEEENNKRQIRTEQYINEEKRWEDLKKKDDIIASLNNEIIEKEKSQKYVLAKIDISKILSGDVGKSLEIFGITFIESLVFITIGLFVCYLIIIGLTRLFVILGIKTRYGSSSRYGQYGRYGSSSYGYGDYNYGYGEKRIKRKYIRKPKQKDKNSEPDKNHKTDAK
ncbi:MAG: hypothetical protein U9R23_03210 [Candidatus Cloacimonadota bacterium]|nr:hypothetical protein [Candidatus Cloacimonadota bacterium]